MGRLMQYEKAGHVSCFLGWIYFVFSAVLTVFITMTVLTENTMPYLAIVLALVFVVFSIVWLVIGQAIKKHKEWSRITGIIINMPLLIGFPVGTLIGGYIIWCLVKGWRNSGDIIGIKIQQNKYL